MGESFFVVPLIVYFLGELRVLYAANIRHVPRCVWLFSLFLIAAA